MQKRRLLVLLLCTVLSIQSFTTITFANASADQALIKHPGYQDFPAYYRDTKHADNQVTHPDVVVMNEPWNGYRYWAVYTPNVNRTSIYENPSIVASSDGENWVEPEGIFNPIEPQPPSTRYHNCDADMIYNPKMNAMMAYWNWADDRAGGVGAEIRLRISYNGVDWGVPVTYNHTTGQWTEPSNDTERRVVSGPKDYITVLASPARYDMLSPAFLYDEYRDTFMMWATNTGDVGYENGQNNSVRLWYSKDGISWSDPIRVNHFLGLDASGRQLAPWHQDVQYIDELKEYWAVSQCFPGRNPDGSVLHLTKSRDGVNWQQVGTRPLLSPGKEGSWDDFQIYRSSLYYEPGTGSKNGTVRVWYSALQKNTRNTMVPDSEGNLTIQAKDHDDRVWRIGYAENSYLNMMRVLLQNPDYTEPPLVTGENLNLSSDAVGNTITVGGKINLTATFSPTDTSDQVIQFTSSSPEVATVDDFGTVTAVSAGTVRITAQTQEGLSANIEFIVVANQSKRIPQSSMTATATSQHSGTSEGSASYVLDGNKATIWHTKYNPIDPLPQSLTVTFDTIKKINKYVYTPRQIGTNGTITQYELYAIKADNSKALITSGNWLMNTSDKTVTFAPVEAKAIELKVIKGAGGFGTAAEINVYEFDDSGNEEVPNESDSIYGDGVKVSYSSNANAITLYLLESEEPIQMSKDSAMGYPVVGGQPVLDFGNYSCVVEKDIVGLMGSGERMTITSKSPSTGLVRTYILETSDTERGTVYTKTSYQADREVAITEFVDNILELYNPGNRVWSYNGGGEGAQSTYDTLQKIDLTDSQTFYRENIQDYRCASIPIADIYAEDGGITVGDASPTRREVRTPVQETADSAKVSIKWPGKTLSAGSETEAGQSFINVHPSDYFMGLRGYANAMTYLGINMIEPENISDINYDLRWESWGWEFNWTIDLIIGKLDELQAAGVKMITLDDGWYDNAGDWGLNPQKFPQGNADMRRLTDAIHERGMTAILWWRPCDGGRTSSKLYKEHPEYFVKNADGSVGKLAGPGRYNSFNGSTGYALCPSSEGALASQVAFIDRAMNDWGFDGFKGDYVWSMPKCYNPAHNHAYPEESTEKQAEFYRITREAMVANNPDCLTLLCNCGVPQDYYAMPYLSQIATADPITVDQTRRRVKAYKALMGDFFPVTTDHNEIWYPSTVGTGALLIEKRAFTGTAQAEYEKWLGIADREKLQKGRFIGNLYSYGFDPYEIYVVEKDGTMYYAFYRDGNKYRPSGSPPIELKGLDPDKMYRIEDYVTNRVVATNLPGKKAIYNYEFSNYLLVKAVEISVPDPDPEDPEEPEDPDTDFQSVDAMDEALVYTGTWQDDQNDAFHAGTARYTSNANASVSFTFEGTAIRWYGQKDTNYGSADVYLDDELVETVSVNGSMSAGLKLFEALNLPSGTHTIRIVCKTPTIDIDRFAYIPATSEPVYVEVDALSNQVVYNGDWKQDDNSAFSEGSAKYTSESGASVELTFSGTAVRWYGQNDTNFGSADVYLDDVLVETVNVNGPMATGVLLFEQTDLPSGEHTIRIVCNTPIIDVDYLCYAT